MNLAALPKDRSRLAEMAIRQLRSDTPLQEFVALPQPRRRPIALSLPHWSFSRFILTLLLLLFLGALFVWSQQRSKLDEMVTIAGGVYTLTIMRLGMPRK